MAAVAAACSGPYHALQPPCLRDVPAAVMLCGNGKGTAFRVGPGVWVTSRHGMPDVPQWCLVDGVRREVIAYTAGEGRGGDWSIVKLARPEIDPVRTSARFAASLDGFEKAWAVGFKMSDRLEVACVVGGRIAESVDAPQDMRTRKFIGLQDDHEPIIPGMSGAPVVAIDDNGSPVVVGVWCGWIEMETTWAGLIRSTSVASLVVIDPDLPVAVERMLRQQP